MNCIAILDASCIIWDLQDYENNTYEYLNLKSKLLDLFDVFANEKPYLLLRDELIAEMIEYFSFDKLPNHAYDYNNRVFDFIINIPIDKKLSCLPNNTGVASVPHIIKAHFNQNTQAEIAYILTYIHDDPKDINCYFTYPHIYGAEDNLLTSNNGTGVQCNTVFFDDEEVLNDYFSQFKKLFEPNPVHHTQNRKNSKKSKLRCYNGRDTIVPQSYLDRALFSNNRYYFYDPVNRVYVVFRRHLDNKYHGHEELNLNEIPPRVREHFNV